MNQKINGYLCQRCLGMTITVHVDEGTTPMYLRCRARTGCSGEAVSQFYSLPDPLPEELAALPRWEWYRPTGAELGELSPYMREHIERGGVALRPPAGMEEAPHV